MSGKYIVNKFSKILTQPKERSAAQSMLYALGHSYKDLQKPQVGICSMWYAGNPCNSKLNKLSSMVNTKMLKTLLPMEFNTIGVSDGMSMGTTGMKYSLLSRDLIADSIETVMTAQHYDSLICIPGCDKNLPGSAIALFRLNRPGFIIYGGSMKSSNTFNSKKLDIVSAFESYGQYLKGEITEKDRQFIIQNSCDKNCGSCSGMYTANTMACILEVMGIMLPNGSSNMSLSSEKIYECEISGKIINNLLHKDLKPLDIVNKETFNNAIKMLYCMGGSTNAVIHLLAMADAANIKLTLDDFKKYENIPVLANMKPHGEYIMQDIYENGGMSKVIKYLIDENIINGESMTITGKTLSENMKNIEYMNHDILKKINKPFKKKSHIKILYGNMAKKGCIAKISSSNKIFKGKALVFDTEQDMLSALKNNKITKKHFIIIRYQGESVGCPEMLSPTSALIGYFGKESPPLATDGRFSGGSHGILVGNLPDAYKDNTMTAIIQNNDEIEINTSTNEINALISHKEYTKRMKNIIKPELKLKGVLKKFSKLSRSIEYGYSA